MSNPSADDAQGSVNPADNLDAWLRERKERDAEPEAETAKSTEPTSPAEPTVAQPEPDPATTEDYTEPWWEQGLAEAKHGFLKGRKGPEVEKAFRHVETAKQRAEREAAELRQQVEQMRIERAAEAAVQRVQGKPQQEPQPDLYAQLEQQFWEKPGATFQQLQQIAVQEAKQQVWQDIQTAQEVAAQQQRAEATVTAGQYAAAEVMRHYGVSQEAAENMVLTAAANLAESDDFNVWFDPRNYLSVIGQLYGDPRPQGIAQPPVAPVTEIPDPPGSKRPASVQRRASEPSQFRTETEELRRSLAQSFGVDPDFAIERARARGGRRA